MIKGCEESYPALQSTIKDGVYQYQLQHREIILNEAVNEDLIERVTMQIINFNREDDDLEANVVGYDRATNPITIYINTDGGLVHDGLAVVSAIVSSRTPVHTVALGKAISMGFLILICGHRRFCQRYSTLMYHQLSAGTGRSEKMRDIIEYAEHLAELQGTLESIVKEHTLLPQEVLDEFYLYKNDKYMNAEEALEWGVVDEII